MRKDSLDEYATKQIRWAAGILARQTGQDIEDLKQDLTLYLLERVPRFEPSRGGWKTFVAQVLHSRRVNLLKKHLSVSEQTRRSTVSLNELLPNEGGGFEERHETLPAPKVDKLSPEVTEVIESLPPDLRELCAVLAQGGPEHARESLGLTLRQLKQRLAQLQRAFRRAGFDEFNMNAERTTHHA